MDFDYSEKTQRLRGVVQGFVDDNVAPRDMEWQAEAHAGVFPLAVVDSIKQSAKRKGLWNFFLPSLRDDQPGMRLTNLEYAPLAEITGRYPWCSEVFNCSSPDSGNMEILQLCATPDQRKRWLDPLLDGSIRSWFSMSEPEVASSDPTNLETTVVRDGDHYLIRGRKWFSTGAKHPNCKFSIVMGRSDIKGEREPHNRYSMIVAPFGTPGLRTGADQRQRSSDRRSACDNPHWLDRRADANDRAASMTLEREATISLARRQATFERIEHMLATRSLLRN
jgi:acyl-CoA dehydrogenase